MRPFDEALINDLIHALDAIPDDATPAWGKLSKAAMIDHLALAFRQPLRKKGEVKVTGGFFGSMAKPVFLNNLLKFPKGADAPEGVMPEQPKGDIDGLRKTALDVIEAFTQDREWAPHTIFGEMSRRDWQRLHVLHCEHHLKQFGALPEGFIHKA